MQISPARKAASEVLLRMDHDQAYAPELLHSARVAKLSTQDHGLATELVMGVLRWRSWLDEEIARYSGRPLAKLDVEVVVALRLGVYQLRFLDRIPARAAINESVELVKRARKVSAAPFVNAVLRKIGVGGTRHEFQQAIESSSTTGELASASAHPKCLVQRWVEEYGFEIARRVCVYDQARPPVAIRLVEANIEPGLRASGIQIGPGKLLASARQIASGDITHMPAFQDGSVTIEDEASQLIGLLVGEGERILDCCAAPGGKTRILAQRNPRAEVVAVELHSHRARLLQKLVREENVRVITADIRALPEMAAFDRILVDAPCSGTGTLARNPEIKWRLEVKDFADLQARQVGILGAALQKLKPGGRLVYATCSLEREENEEVIQHALAGGKFQVRDVALELEALQKRGEIVSADPASLVRGPFLRTLPGVHSCDGFFAALIENQMSQR